MIAALIVIGIYLSGVIVSLVAMAWFNSEEGGNDIPLIWAISSWLFIIIILTIFATIPFRNFYIWCLNRFKKRDK